MHPLGGRSSKTLATPASISGLLLTTEAVITEAPEKDSEGRCASSALLAYRQAGRKISELTRSRVRSYNAAMPAKALVLDAIQKQTEESSFAEIRQRIELMAGVREGLDAIARGEVIPLDEVEKQING